MPTAADHSMPTAADHSMPTAADQLNLICTSATPPSTEEDDEGYEAHDSRRPSFAACDHHMECLISM